MSNPKRVVWLLGAVAILATAGCQSLDGVCLLNCGRSQASSTTLVEFLYPDADVPPPGDPPAPKKKSGCGCAAEGGEGAGLALVGGLGVAALVTRRRRR